MAQLTAIPGGEASSLAWEYLRAWVGATFLDTGPGVAAFLGLLPDAERSALRVRWEACWALWRQIRDGTLEGDEQKAAQAALFAANEALAANTGTTAGDVDELLCMVLDAVAAARPKRLERNEQDE